MIISHFNTNVNICLWDQNADGEKTAFSEDKKTNCRIINKQLIKFVVFGTKYIY